MERALADGRRAARRPRSRPAPPAAPAAPSGPQPASSGVPLRGVRGAVADKLSRSRREIPDATCWVDADATELMRARAAMNAAGRAARSRCSRCSPGSARPRWPATPSSTPRSTRSAREIVRLPAVHLGFAAQTERGLVVPVVRDAHARNAEALTAEFARLTEAARTGTLTPRSSPAGPSR